MFEKDRNTCRTNWFILWFFRETNKILAVKFFCQEEVDTSVTLSLKKKMALITKLISVTWPWPTKIYNYALEPDGYLKDKRVRAKANQNQSRKHWEFNIKKRLLPRTIHPYNFLDTWWQTNHFQKACRQEDRATITHWIWSLAKSLLWYRTHSSSHDP